jgi:hypothetical protein
LLDELGGLMPPPKKLLLLTVAAPSSTIDRRAWCRQLSLGVDEGLLIDRPLPKRQSLSLEASRPTPLGRAIRAHGPVIHSRDERAGRNGGCGASVFAALDEEAADELTGGRASMVAENIRNFQSRVRHARASAGWLNNTAGCCWQGHYLQPRKRDAGG